MSAPPDAESPSHAIARFAVALEFDAIPAAIVAQAKEHLLDALGVGLAAASLPRCRGLHRVAAVLGQGAEATGLGLAAPMPAASAALLNGALIHSLEFDDTHMASIVHGSSVVAATALAAAERGRCDGRSLLTAFIAGWEVFARLGLAAPGAFQAAGFQVTACAGPFAAALVAGKLAGLDHARLVHALGIAGSQAFGTMEYLAHGATVKACHPGWAAHAGLIAAALAAADFTGPPTIFEGPRGLYAQFARAPRGGEALAELCASLGGRWCLAEAAIKPLACCHYIQPFVECLETLLAQGLDPGTIAAIACHVPREELMVICEPRALKRVPRSWFDAKFSLGYCLGARLAHGRLDIDAFEFDAPDPAVLRFADLVTWEALDGSGFPARYPGAITLRTIDGSTLHASVDDVLGGPVRPLPRDAIVEKFSRNARRILAREAVASLADLIAQLDALDDLSALSAALRRIRA